MVGLQPDIILTNGTPATAAVQPETRIIPIVFVISGTIGRLPTRGVDDRMVLGYNPLWWLANYEASLAGKWLELLSEIAPGLKRAAIMFNPDTARVSAYMPLV